MEIANLPPKQGLYDPRFEHDACGVGFVVNIKGEKSHEIVDQGVAGTGVAGDRIGAAVDKGDIGNAADI